MAIVAQFKSWDAEVLAAAEEAAWQLVTMELVAPPEVVGGGGESDGGETSDEHCEYCQTQDAEAHDALDDPLGPEEVPSEHWPEVEHQPQSLAPPRHGGMLPPVHNWHGE